VPKIISAKTQLKNYASVAG